MILAIFGLGSFTLSMWFARYRWLFIVGTVILLSFAYYRAYKSREHNGPWNTPFLYGVTVLCVGMIVYTLVTNY